MIYVGCPQIHTPPRQVLLEQGDPQSRVFLITQGSVQRLRYLNEQLHQVETVGSDSHRFAKN